MEQIFVWTLGDVLVLSALSLFIVFALFAFIVDRTKQAFCKHDGGVNETRACNAICRKCGKNLGFIGRWRDNNKEMK